MKLHNKSINWQSKLWIMLLPLTCLLGGCDVGCGPGSNSVYDLGIGFELYDRTSGQRLLGNFGRYHPDTVKIYDGEGKVVFDGPVDRNGVIYLPVPDPDTDADAFQTTKQKTFYVYLNYLDTDTMQIEFSLRRDECGEEQFKSFQWTYNDQVSNKPYNMFYKHK